MFTGLIRDRGEIVAIDRDDAGATISVRTALLDEIALGDSVAVNGVCLTVTLLRKESFEAEVMHETLRRTSIGLLTVGDTINLELALRATDRLGGHIVQGHVDGTAKLAEVSEDGFARVLTFEISPALTRYLIEKGSIAVEGVSLTIAALDRESVSVSLIPETLERTTLGEIQRGSLVNIEVDLLSKYVEKLVAPLA